MKSVLDNLPDVIMPDAAKDSDASSIPLEHPDDGDLLRPLAEDELPSAGRRGSLMGADTSPLSRNLIWTFGPVHRAMPFPLQLRFEISGDRILSVDPEIGWTHQGLERSLETANVEEGFALLGRLYPRTPLFGQLLWAHAWEEVLDLQKSLPDRVKWLRTAGLEISRVVAHLRVLMVLAEVYADRLSQQIFSVASLRAAQCLDRLQYCQRDTSTTDSSSQNIFCQIGGMHSAPDLKTLKEIDEDFHEALEKVSQMRDQQLRNAAFVDGLRKRGQVSIRSLLDVGVTGPALRAAGVHDDLRLRSPIFAYEKCPPQKRVQNSGDALARATQLLDEVGDAARMASFCMKEAQRADPSLRTSNAPDLLEEYLKCGSSSLHVVTGLEAAEGELCLSLHLDPHRTEKPSPDVANPLNVRRVRLKTPSFSLAAALPLFLENAQLDDVVPILLGLGMVGSAVDR